MPFGPPRDPSEFGQNGKPNPAAIPIGGGQFEILRKGKRVGHWFFDVRISRCIDPSEIPRISLDKTLLVKLGDPHCFPLIGLSLRKMNEEIDRIMPMIQRIRPPRKFGSRKGDYVALTKEARQIIDELARETNCTPTEVLKRSVTLYKMALEDLKRSSKAATNEPKS